MADKNFTKIKSKTRKVQFPSDSVSADKGFNVYVLDNFVGNFRTIADCRQAVIMKYNLHEDKELAYSRDVSIETV